MNDYRWELMLSDGYILEGCGNEKSLKNALRTPGVVDGDVWWEGIRKGIDFWMFLIQ